MELLKARAVRPGDTVGIVSTSSPVSDAQLRVLTGYLTGRGYGVRVADGAGERAGHLAGSAQRRAAGVMSMFTDPEVALVLPANGGSGAEHLVGLLDYGVIRANPKLFTGFSNPTSLVNSVLAAAGLATAHGVTGFQFFTEQVHDPWTEAEFWRMVSGPVAGREVSGDGWRVHRAAGLPAVSGPVIGGNLFALRHLVAPAGCRPQPERSCWSSRCTACSA